MNKKNIGILMQVCSGLLCVLFFVPSLVISAGIDYVEAMVKISGLKLAEGITVSVMGMEFLIGFTRVGFLGWMLLVLPALIFLMWTFHGIREKKMVSCVSAFAAIFDFALWIIMKANIAIRVRKVNFELNEKIGFTFSIILLIVITIMSVLTLIGVIGNEEQEKIVSQFGKWVCPNCECNNTGKDQFCSDCGNAKPIKMSKVKQKHRYCAYCGSYLLENAKFCVSCGQEVK